MKQTVQVKIAKFFILLATILFLSAIVMKTVNTEIHVNNVLYLLAIISFSVGAVLALTAAYKDKEHMKNVELSKKDERIKTIRCLSKSKAFDAFSFIFPLVVMFCSGLKIIDSNASIIFGIMCLIPLALQLYYFTEISKKM